MAKESLARKMRKQYCRLLPLLQGTAKYLERLLEDLPKHDFHLETDVKAYKRTAEKAKERELTDLTELPDLVRGRLFFSDNFDYQEVLDLLKELFDDNVKIKKIDHKHENNHGLKYHGVVHMDLKMGDLNFELQVLPIEFKPFKKMLHKVYQQLRTNHHLSPEKKEGLKDLHNRIYRKLLDKSKKNRKSD